MPSQKNRITASGMTNHLDQMTS